MSENNGSPVDGGNPPVDGGQNAPVADAKWYSTAPEELRGFAELKGWDSPEKALTSYKNLEKFQGLPPERLAKVPDANDTAGWGEFNKRFGWAAPEKAEDYGLQAPEGMAGDLLGPLAEIMKASGVPAEMGKKLVDGYYNMQSEAMKAEDARLEALNASETAKLKTEWGGEYDKLAQLADRAQTEFSKKAGISEDHMALMREAMGPRAFTKLWAEIGGSTGEAKFIEGGGSNSGTAMTPEAAKARLDQLGQDKAWFQRFEAGGVAEKQEFQRLQQILMNATLAPR